jgi:signal transduction histidine kinase
LLSPATALLPPQLARRTKTFSSGYFTEPWSFRCADFWVHYNEDQLIRMLLNVLDNAIRYSPVGSRITIHCEQRNGAFHLSIRDTGPGIASHHLPHVFDRFYRVDTGRSRAQGGSGLGLAIAQSIAQLHGGEISVSSTVGQGSTFTVRLPMSRQRTQDEHANVSLSSQMHVA